MFEVTRALFHAEMATAVYEHMRQDLPAKDRGHCERVNYLPLEVMRMVCKQLREDPAIQAIDANEV